MSTTFTVIEGRKESGKLKGNMIPDYEPETVYFNRFWGGKEPMLQITIGMEYVQLTGQQVDELVKTLSLWRVLPEIDH